MSNFAMIGGRSVGLTLFYHGKQHTVPARSANLEAILEMVNQDEFSNGDVDEDVLAALDELVNPVKAVQNFVGTINGAEVRDGELYWNGKPMHNTISVRVLAFLDEGHPVKPLVNFVNRLMSNPSYSSRMELLDFLGNRNMPITNDGYFLAYKRVKWGTNENGEKVLVDCYTGTVDNSIGAEPFMARGNVDDNRNHHCSHGFHCGGMDYVGSYCNYQDNPIVIVRVDPADAVSVPTDSSFNKLRVCRYKVVGMYEGDMKGALYTDEGRSVEVESDYDEWEDDDDYYDDYE